MHKDRFYIPISMSKERHEQIFGKKCDLAENRDSVVSLNSNNLQEQSEKKSKK
jgi:hypothetical protein